MLAIAIGFIGMLFFAGSIPFTTLALQGFDPAFTTFTRAFLAGIGALVILLCMRRPWPDKTHVGLLFLIAVMIAMLFPGFMALSLTYVGPAHGAVVLGLIPLISSSMSVLMTGVKPKPSFWAASISAGLIVIIFTLYESKSTLQFGDVFMVMGAMATAFGFNLSAKLSKHMPSWEIICWALVFILPFSGLGMAVTWQGLPQATATTSLSWIWIGLIYSGLGSMLFGYIFFTMGLNMGGVARIGQLQYLQVFFTLGIAATINHDPLRIETLLTASLVTLFVVLAMRAKPQT